ncbi:FHA domain-containing protein [Rhodococcus opacus]|nr:FHA domain-containing protein [Rhodococcus opacus]RZL84984.1 MAG: FHA domain-containing protein [Rhodococcus sp. (in: high G+C Gram-positive bacteria)]
MIVNAPGGPRLCYSDGAGHFYETVLSADSPRVTLGRSTDADIAFEQDRSVSRLHATVEWIGTHWTVVDDGLSRNGTFVNGDRLVGRKRLRSGDRISIGSSVVTFHVSGGVSGEMTDIADAMPTRSSLTQSQTSVLMELCRPYKGRTYANPASNQEIADRLFISVETVKSHLRALFAKFGVENLPQNQKRARLAERAMQSGIVSEREL